MRFLALPFCAALLAAQISGCARLPAAVGSTPRQPVREAAFPPSRPAIADAGLSSSRPWIGVDLVPGGEPTEPSANSQPPARQGGLAEPNARSIGPDPGLPGSTVQPLESGPDPVFEPNPLGILRSLSGGLVSVGEFGRESEPAGFAAQLLPRDTNLAAQHDAELWAPDAKQMYIAAGFWRTPYLGITKHVFYSPLRDQKYIVYYRVLKGIVRRRVVPAGPDYKTAADILRGAQDVYSYDLVAAHDRARQAAYRPDHPVTVGVLIHPMVIGPCWVFLNNPDDQEPRIAIRARDGMIFREGDLAFEAIKLLVRKSDDPI